MRGQPRDTCDVLSTSQRVENAINSVRVERRIKPIRTSCLLRGAGYSWHLSRLMWKSDRKIGLGAAGPRLGVQRRRASFLAPPAFNHPYQHQNVCSSRYHDTTAPASRYRPPSRTLSQKTCPADRKIAKSPGPAATRPSHRFILPRPAFHSCGPPSGAGRWPPISFVTPSGAEM